MSKKGYAMEFEKLQKVIAEVLSVDPKEITLETTFVEDLGADSLDLYQVVMGIEEMFAIVIAEEETGDIETVAQAFALIQSKLPQEG